MGVVAGLPAVASFPQSRFVLDGGILLNQPLSPALASTYAQPADRQIRRLLLHVNPDPRSAIPAELGDIIGAGTDRADEQPTLAAVLQTLVVRRRLRGHRRRLHDLLCGEGLTSVPPFAPRRRRLRRTGSLNRTRTAGWQTAG